MGSVFFSHKSVVLAFTLISFGVCAESGTAWDLDNMQKQRVLYEAKAALNKAKAEAENQGYDVSVPGNSSMNGGGHPAAVSVGDSLPQLVKINGRNAVVSMSDGNTTSVTAGQILPGGRWQVLSVGLGGVKVKNIATQRTQIIN
ncbi:type IV pilus biogenesis protein PilP [Enterobacter cancerogenus]|uniref:Type IV pilus biogenesis protein PilP n=1 Tax=Enterobacter cancerogenus TaxID=69218 RepID=A0AB38NYS1_9ENTR|nr:type IV pilus biogenesis protein PilP [Enterobacter cancerogenus]TKK13648.1 type IV pilus biogenesis protein PilP [Enterobacter cancerogenus]